jgi:hypothetical protein
MVLGEDGFSGGGPDEWLWVLISMFDPICDRLFEFINGVEVLRRMRWRVISANRRSTILSHEQEVGVKCIVKRLC